MIDLGNPVAHESDAARVAALALREDGMRDVTSEACLADRVEGEAQLVARQALVLAGTAYASAVVEWCALPPITWSAHDGDRVDAGAVLGQLRGNLARLLRAERPMLNLLQRAAGIATVTRSCVERLEGTGCRVLHTRKTTPGLRRFEVSAVVAGGGSLHRLGLADTVMIKDNHWAALAASGRSLAEALAAARNDGVTELQVEVESEVQLREACAAGATRLLIDNQQPAVVAEWARLARELRADITLEATGGITLETLADYGATGVDCVSTGMLTHSVRSADIGMDVRDEG